MKEALPVKVALAAPASTAANEEVLGRETARETTRANCVTGRAFVLGLLFAAGMAGFNCWIETVASVHFLGGVQMPFGAVFVLGFFVLGVNGTGRLLGRVVPWARRRLFSPAELLTIYAMLLFSALISTPGTDNFFLTTGPTLFYFSTRENGWAGLFYRYIPPTFAPGWDGQTYQTKVIEPLYTGGLSLSEIPWHAWSAMLIAWGIFLLLIYATLFFVSLLLRRQWIESEALAFPLVQLPLQMVDVEPGAHPPARAFWGNRLMWMGFALAAGFHLLRGLNNFYPDWPLLTSFQGNDMKLDFTEQPWNAIGTLSLPFFLGAIGVAYLLTREVALSFWVFFLLAKYELVLAQQLGFPVGTLPKDTYLGRPTFITFQSAGGWMMMAALLLWTARGHLLNLLQQAWQGERAPNEPFAPRFVIGGFAVSCLGLLGWSWFSGINVLIALAFFGLYLLISLVLARLVIEGGFIFPQVTFAPLELLTNGMMGSGPIGASNLARLSFVQPMLMSDMRTNLLPAFLHTLKIAHETKMDPRNVRRLMGSAACAIVVSLSVMTFASIWTLYHAGGLTGYTWFTYSGPQTAFKGAAAMLKSPTGVQPLNWLWMSVGAAIVWLMTLARARFLWFPLHPLGFIVASGFPITRLWPSFFVGWAVKSLIGRFGGNSAVVSFRPFMIGLILGNLSAMVLWMILGFFLGSQIPYWPA